MKIQFERIATQLQVDVGYLIDKATKINDRHQLGIYNFDSVTATQYDIIRSLLDEDYLVRMLGKGNSDRKYKYNSVPGYNALEEWLEQQGDMTNMGTRYLQSILPSHIETRGQQVISTAMRDLGYSIRRIVIDGKVARRWYKRAYQTPPSFL